MATNTKLSAYKANSVNGLATSTDLLDIIPTGSIFILQKFGGFDPNNGDNKSGMIGVHWGEQNGVWIPIRECGYVFELIINREFIGNGIKRLKLVRQNNSLTPKPMVAWVEGLIKTP